MHVCVCHCKVKAYYFLFKYLNHSIVIKMQHNIEGFFYADTGPTFRFPAAVRTDLTALMP